MARYRGKPAQWRPFWTLSCWQACTNVLFKKVVGFGLVCWVPQRCCSVAWFVLQLSSWGTAGGQPSQLLTLSLELPCLDFIADGKFMYFYNVPQPPLSRVAPKLASMLETFPRLPKQIPKCPEAIWRWPWDWETISSCCTLPCPCKEIVW